MSADVLFCPAGLTCLAILIAGVFIWLTAFPKWPMIAMTAQAMVGGAVAALIFVVPTMAANAQEMTRDEAKEEARDLAAGKEAEIAAGATQSVDADSVPGFVTDTPSETAHYGDAPGLESAGFAATFADDTAVAVHDSMASRPIVTASELSEWTANGLAVESDATSIVAEYGGAYGDCTTTISGGTSGATYSYACNEGETLVEYTGTCRNTLDVTFTNQYVHQCIGRYLRGDISWEPEAHCFTLRTEPSCGPLNLHSGGTCIRDSRGNLRCSPQRFRATCSVDTIDGRAAIETIPGPPIDTWDTGACDLRDADPDCSLVSEICVDGPATRTIDGQSVTRECWAFERSYQCASLGGTVDDCNVPSGCTLEDSLCLSSDDATGECRTYEHTYTCTAPGSPGSAVGYCDEDVYCIDGDCETLTRPQNTEFSQAVSALSFLGELQDDVDEATLEIFPGDYAKCDKVIAGLQNCCSNDGFLTAIGFGCSADDQALANKQEAGLCHYVGTYCSNKTLFGICLKKRKTFCCFNNKLARIIHEQGRPQLGADWGPTKTPDCAGFTVAMFQQLDLSVMDFSEFYNEVLDSFVGPDGDAATAAIRDRIINAYQCPPNC